MKRNTACVALLLLGLPAWTQTQINSARISGVVTDAQGGAVPEARVTLANPQTGFAREFSTRETGQYAFTLVPAGQYDLRVEKPGFSVYLRRDIVLVVGQSVTVDPTLAVGSVTETVSVVGNAAMLATGDANIGSEVTAKQIQELPLNLRNPYFLVGLDSKVNNSVSNQRVNSGVLQSSVDQDATSFHYSGNRWNTNLYILDGHVNDAGDWDAILFAPSADELQEFKIQTNTFSAQYGWTSGSVVNAITRSGSSAFHGGFFEFIRNSAFDANNFFSNRNNLPKSVFQRNQFGANVGGPVRLPGHRLQNKLFFFGSWESLRQGTPKTLVTTVPTLEQRAGDFSRTLNRDGSLAAIYNPFTTVQQGGTYVRQPFPGNRIPAQMIDPVASALIPYWPAPNRPGDAFTAGNNFAGASAVPAVNDQYTIRVDHNITDSQRLFGRWSQKRQQVQRNGAFFGADNPGGPGQHASNNRLDGGMGYTYTVSPTLVINTSFGYGRWVEISQPQGMPFQPSTLGLPAALDNFGGRPGAFPGISPAGVAGLGSGTNNRWPRDTITTAVDVTKIYNSHTLSMGFMGIIFNEKIVWGSNASFGFGATFTQGPNPVQADPTTGAGFASFLLGTGTSGGITAYAGGAAFNKKQLGWYFNDDWKIARNLTVNLGLRYDIETPQTERFDQIAYYSFARNPVSDLVGLDLKGGIEYTGKPNPRGVYDTRYRNLAPRLGFAYSATPKIVLRSGFGLFFTPSMLLQMDRPGFTQLTPYVGTVDGFTPENLLNDPFPNGFLSPTGKSLGMLTYLGQSINEPLRDRPSPYMEQWMFGVQYQLSPATIVEASYTGNHGVKLPYTRDSGFQINQLPPSLLSLGNSLLEQVPNPFYGVITSGSLSFKTVSRGQLLLPYPQFTGVALQQQPGAMSTYHALNVSANRRFSKGLHFLASFTWSKYLSNLDDVITWYTSGVTRNWYNTALDKGPVSDDIPRSLVLSYIYELPVGKGKPLAPASAWLDAVVGGWSISGVSTFKDGYPLGFTAANNTNSYGGNQTPNIVGDPGVANPTPDRWFNPAAFAQPAPFTFGNAPRTAGYVRAGGINNFDVNLAKSWRLWNETSRLQFRTEAFNLFNRVAFFGPDTNLANRTFGTVTTAGPGRSLQFAIKVSW